MGSRAGRNAVDHIATRIRQRLVSKDIQASLAPELRDDVLAILEARDEDLPYKIASLQFQVHGESLGSQLLRYTR
jgi:hypothetical protein